MAFEVESRQLGEVVVLVGRTGGRAACSAGIAASFVLLATLHFRSFCWPHLYLP